MLELCLKIMTSLPSVSQLTPLSNSEIYEAKTPEKLKLVDRMADSPAVCSWEKAGHTSPERIDLNCF